METQETTTPTSPTLGNRILNVFASPSEAFQGIDALPSKTSLWLIPYLLAIVVLVIVMFVISSNEVLRGQLTDLQIRGIEQRVEDNAMTQQEADQAIQAIENMGGLFIAIGIVAGIVFMTLAYFGGPLFLWLTGKFAFKAPAGYSTYLGAYGLASWIGILGAIVTALLMTGLGSMHASAGLALVIPDFDALDTTHRILARVELFAIWQAFVMGLGLSSITGKSAGTGIATAIVLWLIWVVVSSLLGLSM